MMKKLADDAVFGSGWVPHALPLPVETSTSVGSRSPVTGSGLRILQPRDVERRAL